MELLRELLRSGAGEQLLRELGKLKDAAEKEVQTSARNRPIEEVRLRAGRVEGIEATMQHIEKLRTNGEVEKGTA